MFGTIRDSQFIGASNALVNSKDILAQKLVSQLTLPTAMQLVGNPGDRGVTLLKSRPLPRTFSSG